LAQESAAEITEQNAKYRTMYAEHEHKMKINHSETSELKRQVAVLKGNNERVREENEAYKQ
jgi:hypothetical protein